MTPCYVPVIPVYIAAVEVHSFTGFTVCLFLVVWYATRVFATYLLAMYDAAWYKMTD